MAGCFRRTIGRVLAAGLTLASPPAARARQIVDEKQTWIISNRSNAKFEQIYGEVQNISLEALCDPAQLTINGAVRTRGVLVAGPRPRPTSGPGAKAPGGGPQGPSGAGTTTLEERRYSLTLPTDGPLRLQSCGLRISPGLVVADAFDFEADSLNFREIEVVGTFEAPVGSDRGPSPGGFWFWAYSRGPERPSQAGRTGLLALEDLVARPDRLAGEIVKVVGQFRGKNLFGDLGRWVQVTGKLDRKGNVTRLKATEVALVPPPPEAPEP